MGCRPRQGFFLQENRVLSTLEYCANVVGYGRSDIHLAVDSQLKREVEIDRDVVPQNGAELFAAGYEIGMDAFKKTFGISAADSVHPFQNPRFHKAVMPSLQTSNSTGGKYFAAEYEWNGRKKLMTNRTKLATFMHDPMPFFKHDISIKGRVPEVDDSLESLQKFCDWIKTRPIQGPGSDILTSKNPGFYAERSVPGVKARRWVLMIPQDIVIKYEAVLTMLLARNMSPEWYAAWNQTSQVYADHLMSLSTGVGARLLLSTDFSAYDAHEFTSMDACVIAGLVKALRDSGMAERKVFGLSLIERLVIPKILYYNAYFADKLPTKATPGIHYPTPGFLRIGPIDARLSGENKTAILNSLVHFGAAKYCWNRMGKIDVDELVREIESIFGWSPSREQVSNSQLLLSKIRPIALRILGDDGLTDIPIPELHGEEAAAFYMSLCASYKYLMASVGLAIGAAKTRLGRDICEFLKVMFIRGVNVPNKLQLLPQRERSPLGGDVIEGVKNVLTMMATQISRGWKIFPTIKISLAQCALKWNVFIKGSRTDLPIETLYSASHGPGMCALCPWVGPVGKVADWYSPQGSFVALDQTSAKADLVRSTRHFYSSGKKYVRSTLIKSRLDDSIEMGKVLESLNLDSGGALSYSEFDSRMVDKAAATGPVSKLAWQESKLRLTRVTLSRPSAYSFVMGDSITPKLSPEEVPVADLDPAYARILGIIGISASRENSYPGIVSYLRRIDPQFPADPDETSLFRYLSKLPRSALPFALVRMGFDSRLANSVDLDEMLSQSIPDSVEYGALTIFLPYADLSNSNLERFISVPISDFPAMRRSLLLLGLCHCIMRGMKQTLIFTSIPDPNISIF